MQTRRKCLNGNVKKKPAEMSSGSSEELRVRDITQCGNGHDRLLNHCHYCVTRIIIIVNIFIITITRHSSFLHHRSHHSHYYLLNSILRSSLHYHASIRSTLQLFYFHRAQRHNSCNSANCYNSVNR